MHMHFAFGQPFGGRRLRNVGSSACPRLLRLSAPPNRWTTATPPPRGSTSPVGEQRPQLLDAARMMGADRESGSIAEGKFADVIAVRAAPLRHIDVLIRDYQDFLCFSSSRLSPSAQANSRSSSFGGDALR